MQSYWKSRKDYNYYKKVLEIIQSRKVEHDHFDSIIDVGGRDTEILKDLSFGDKVCLDISKLPENTSVRTIMCDFYRWVPDKNYHVVTCLQVLEHLDDPTTFAKKLFDLSNGIVIISVPYKWPKGFCKYHVQDPVTEDKILGWTGRKCLESYVIEDSGVQRIICVYDLTGSAA